MLFTIEIIHGDTFKNAFNVFSGKLSVAVLGVKSSKGDKWFGICASLLILTNICIRLEQ